MPTVCKRLVAVAAAAAIIGGGLFGSADISAGATQHVSRGCTARRAIALTFDDGPNPTFTPRILDVLDARGAKATFFEAGGQAAAYPEIVRRVAADGMAVGSQSYEHSDRLPVMTPRQFTADLLEAQSVLSAQLGYVPSLFRPPFGKTSTSMLRVLRARGYLSVGWDLDSTDWRGDATPDQIAQAVLDGAHPGAIVLLHDGGLGGGNPDRSATLAALPRIIDGLRARGYELQTAPQILGVNPAQDGHGPPEPACSAS